MKNYIIKKTLNALANAPQIACKTVLQELPNEDKQDALRLFKALNVDIQESNGRKTNNTAKNRKNFFQFMDNSAVRKELDEGRVIICPHCTAFMYPNFDENEDGDIITSCPECGKVFDIDNAKNATEKDFFAK